MHAKNKKQKNKNFFIVLVLHWIFNQQIVEEYST